MAYATNAQVASEAKVANGFSATTNPTSTKVDEIIAEVEAMIDSRLSQKYVLPIINSTPKILLRGISLALCVERVREIMEVKTGKQNVEQMQWKSTADYARKNLERIISGEMPLVGETLASSKDGVNSFLADKANPCVRDPYWEKDRDQW